MSQYGYLIRIRETSSIYKVQKKATKIIPEIRHLPYGERLKACKLPTLAYISDKSEEI